MVERVSDFKMPEKVVTKLLKDALPDNVVVSKDAKNAACRSASIFILQLSIAAAEKAQHCKRRTLENQDIIKAVTDLGLGEYAPQLVRFGAQRKRNARRRESNITKTKTPKKTQLDEAIEDPLQQDTPDMGEYEPNMTEPNMNEDVEEPPQEEGEVEDEESELKIEG